MQTSRSPSPICSYRGKSEGGDRDRVAVGVEREGEKERGGLLAQQIEQSLLWSKALQTQWGTMSYLFPGDNIYLIPLYFNNLSFYNSVDVRHEKAFGVCAPLFNLTKFSTSDIACTHIHARSCKLVRAKMESAFMPSSPFFSDGCN